VFERYQLWSTPFSTVGFTVFRKADETRMLHDHQWSFISIILRGGYTEIVADDYGLPTRERRHRWLSWHHMYHEQGHSITSVKPGTVTLLLCGPRVRRHFRMWTPDGKLDAHLFFDWLESKGLTEQARAGRALREEIIAEGHG
jgi:hypothetical protein